MLLFFLHAQCCSAGWPTPVGQANRFRQRNRFAFLSQYVLNGTCWDGALHPCPLHGQSTTRRGARCPSNAQGLCERSVGPSRAQSGPVRASKRAHCARDCPRNVVGKASPLRGAASCRVARRCDRAEDEATGGRSTFGEAHSVGSLAPGMAPRRTR